MTARAIRMVVYALCGAAVIMTMVGHSEWGVEKAIPLIFFSLVFLAAMDYVAGRYGGVTK